MCTGLSRDLSGLSGTVNVSWFSWMWEREEWDNYEATWSSLLVHCRVISCEVELHYLTHGERELLDSELPDVMSTFNGAFSIGARDLGWCQAGCRSRFGQRLTSTKTSSQQNCCRDDETVWERARQFDADWKKKKNKKKNPSHRIDTDTVQR